MRRIALVTGAGSGIGRAAAIALAETGFAVVLAGRRKELLETAAAEAGNEAKALTVDVCESASVSALFAQVEETFGRLDLLFNNAGVSVRPVPFEDIQLADWRAAIDTNLTGAFLCTQQAFRLMRRQTPRGGRIINNGSISASARDPFPPPTQLPSTG